MPRNLGVMGIDRGQHRVIVQPKSIVTKITAFKVVDSFINFYP